MSIYKNAVSSWIVELTSKSCELCIIVVLADVSEWVRIYSSECYNKTGDFILDLYWSGCNNDWLTFNTWLTRIWLVQLIEPWPRILYWTCVLLPSGETRNHMNIRKERSRLWDRSSAQNTGKETWKASNAILIGITTMRCVHQREPSTTYHNHPQQFLTRTHSFSTTRKKGHPNITDDTSHLRSRHQYQPGNISTGDHALRDFPATQYKYSRRHQGNTGDNSISEVCRNTYSNPRWDNSQPTKALPSSGPRG